MVWQTKSGLSALARGGALALLWVAALAGAAGCTSPAPKGGAKAKGAAAAPVEKRPEGVRPEVSVKELDPRGLDERWSFYLGQPVTKMWLVDDAVYAFTKKRELYAIGLDDGFVRWVYLVNEELAHPPSAYSYKRDGLDRKDELYLVTKDTLFCLDKDAGFALWKKQLPFGSSSAPAASMSHVYVGSWDNRIYAIDKRDQTVGWTFRTGAPITAKAEAAEKTVEAVYVASEDGHVYAFNPVREDRKWAFATRGPIQARPLFFRNAVYVGSTDMNFYCIRALDGNEDWRYSAGAPITKEPVAYTRDTVYAIAGESHLLAMKLDAKKDYVRWTFDGVDRIVAKGRRDLYVLDTAGQVVAIVDETGKPRWAKPLTPNADFVAMNPYDPTSFQERDKRLASTIVFGYRDGWMIAVKEKSEF